MSVSFTPQAHQVRAPGAPLRAPRELLPRNPNHRPEAARNLMNTFNLVSNEAPGAPVKEVGHADAVPTDIASVRANLFGTERTNMTIMNAPRKAVKSGDAGKPDDQLDVRANLFSSK